MNAHTASPPAPVWTVGRKILEQLLAGYGALFMAHRPWMGALVLAATLCDPATGITGLAAVFSALAARRFLGLGRGGAAEILNALYVGLVLGSFLVLDARLLSLALLGGALVPLLGAALSPVLYRAKEIPLLGAPFLSAAWMLIPAARALGIPLRTVFPSLPVELLELLPQSLAFLLAETGALFYVANPLSGLLVLAAMLASSRAITLLALAGGSLAWGLVMLAQVAPGSPLPLLAAFNGALAAMLLGGMLATPSPRALAVSFLGVILATALSAALLAVLWPLSIPPLSAPFLLAVWLLKASLRPDLGAGWARHWLPIPARAEAGLASRRLARARGVDPAGIALCPPFQGNMEVSQGVDGLHTHQGPWRYALDFVAVSEGCSFRGDGARLEDYYAFDQPVLSPAWGVVSSCRDGIPDNHPGATNLTENWGNHVLIALANGDCVLLAHLRQGSLCVAPGQTLVPGTAIGRVGNSGRSTQPHLHVHVQRGFWLGAPTRPFHLSGFVANGQFLLDRLPATGSQVLAPPPAPPLAGALALTPGKTWHFSLGKESWTLALEAGLLGELALVSRDGGRVLAHHDGRLLALFRRHGAPDAALDAFILAFGLTPFAEGAQSWRDAPLADILPLGSLDRLRLVLRHPFGANLESGYERHWDARRQLWVQKGRHRISALGGDILAESEAWLSEAAGPVAFRLSLGGQTLVHGKLAALGSQGDHGIPAWSAPYSCAA